MLILQIKEITLKRNKEFSKWINIRAHNAHMLILNEQVRQCSLPMLLYMRGLKKKGKCVIAMLLLLSLLFVKPSRALRLEYCTEVRKHFYFLLSALDSIFKVKHIKTSSYSNHHFSKVMQIRNQFRNVFSLQNIEKGQVACFEVCSIPRYTVELEAIGHRNINPSNNESLVKSLKFKDYI